MIQITIDLPIGTAFKFARWLESQELHREAREVWEAIDEQGTPQIDDACKQLQEILDNSQ